MVQTGESITPAMERAGMDVLLREAGVADAELVRQIYWAMSEAKPKTQTITMTSGGGTCAKCHGWQMIAGASYGYAGHACFCQKE